MATLTAVDGVNAASRKAEPSVKVEVSEQYGRVRRSYDSFAIDAADEFGTSGLIDMMKLPKGARIVDASLVMPASGATGIVDVGWDGGLNGDETADPNGIFAAADPGDAAVDAKLDKTLPGYNRKFVDEVLIQIDVTELTADAGGDTWELEIYYVVD